MSKVTFDIKTLMNTASLEQSSQIKRKKLNYKQLESHIKNHYSLTGIPELADAIEDVGLMQDIIVKNSGKVNSNDEPLYTIISGHRRYLAIKELVENRGKQEFSEIFCKIIDKTEDETLTQIRLHLANTTAREMTEYDKMIAISELKRLLTEAKNKGIVIKGKVRDIIADNMNLGATQVQKYLNISEKASEETKQALQNGEISVKEAYDTTIKENEVLNKNIKENGYKKMYSRFKSVRKIAQEMEIEDEKFFSLLKELEEYLNAKNDNGQ